MMSTLTTQDLARKLERAALDLEDARTNLLGASVAHDEAKRALTLAEAERLIEGVEGRNEAQRAARLRLDLRELHDALSEAETSLAEARCEFDNARLHWDLARYRVRLACQGQDRVLTEAA